MGNTTPTRRCTHLPATARGLGPVRCPSCGWVEDGVPLTAQQVLASHPELRAQVEGTAQPQHGPSAQREAPPTERQLASVGEVVRRLLSIRLIVIALFGGVLVAVLLSLIARPLGYAFFPVFLVLWIGTALSRDYALDCPHCRKRVKMGANVCHHCGRTVR